MSVQTVRVVRPTSQFIEVPSASHGGGSAARSFERRPVSSIYSQDVDMNRGSSSRIDRASSIYPPTISPPDSPRLSDADSSQPNISPISTNAPSQPWLRPSGIPAPASARKSPPKQSPSDSPSLTPAPLAAASKQGGWRDAVRAMGRTPSPAQQERPDMSESQGSAPTRWDTYSGEKSNDGRGKAGTVSPNQHPYKGTDPGFGYTAHISGGTAKPSHFLHVKLRKPVERKAEASPPQEPWRAASGIRGPSGRTAVVDPVADRPTPPEKKHFPTPAERRARGFFQKTGASGRASPGPDKGLGIRSETPTGRETPQPDEKPSALKVMTGALDSMREAAAKAMPQKDRSATEPTRQPNLPPSGEVTLGETKVFKYRLGGGRSNSQDESPATPSSDFGPPVQKSYGPRAATMPVQGNFTSSPASYAPASSQNSYSIPPRKDSRLNPSGPAGSAHDDFDPQRITFAFNSMGFSNEPKSHFSATTYNTSVGTESPPETPHIIQPGVDEVPPLPSSVDASSILNRKRPVPSTANQYKVKPTRKPTPMENAPSGGAAAAAGGTMGTDEQGASGLATPPSEPAKPVDRVTALEKQLASLNKRKASLAAVIHELTNVVQPSSIAYDMASRAEIKKTVEGLRAEQDGVLQEIQEVGIKLHRAYKRRDDELGGSGGTGLWVRRVTE